MSRGSLGEGYGALGVGARPSEVADVTTEVGVAAEARRERDGVVPEKLLSQGYETIRIAPGRPVVALRVEDAYDRVESGEHLEGAGAAPLSRRGKKLGGQRVGCGEAAGGEHVGDAVEGHRRRSFEAEPMEPRWARGLSADTRGAQCRDSDDAGGQQANTGGHVEAASGERPARSIA